MTELLSMESKPPTTVPTPNWWDFAAKFYDGRTDHLVGLLVYLNDYIPPDGREKSLAIQSYCDYMQALPLANLDVRKWFILATIGASDGDDSALAMCATWY